MSRTSISFGVILILLGAVFYFKTGMHPTALIPSVIGFILAICGVVGAQELRRKHAMHAAAGVALLGFLGCIDGVIKTVRLVFGTAVTRPEAQYEKALTALICAAFLFLCVQSFRAARSVSR